MIGASNRRPLKALGSRELIERVTARDTAAIAELYQRFAPMMFRAARGVLSDDKDRAEDVVQDIFTKLVSSGAIAVRDPDKLLAFLVSAARHRALDVLRAKNVRGESRIERPATDDRASVESWKTNNEVAAARERLREKLNSIDEETRKILELRFVDGDNLTEIARKLRVSYAAAAQRLSRALRKVNK